MEKTFEEAMNFRHACKIFDETKKISNEDLNYILEAGRKSPSSFGQEPWKFLVITNDELKAKLRVHCWDQVQITSCSHLVVVLAKIEEVRDYEGEVRRKFNRRDLPKDMVDAYIIKYANHQKEYFSNDFNTFSWTSRQTYIALGNMMTAAAVKGVDSCPIEGFDKEDVEKVLNLDTKKYQVSVILPLGYRVKEQSIKQREKLEDIIEFIN
ncbi:NAD(P)H-dependent oxidoreductase [Aliarcobacter trophiarum LMG 25534]|uniref:NAD(P)H-dependent oxidoreductase n=1 Tax=Aliarcobacter trophiarum LMG 25534 TaxID=1032241 RepID=A0AAD0QJP1_9BACT|nr:NAD(P)H-dependent oxidoreductase [Aliarcobacter trophiarum]AXK48728.1 nitroreductase [Aliarcobacter trophiarum LMG 25534]RXI28277.1 NAD(P)H-dependent oxidoreductase [Aliarcobacter trophiarum]RXJ91328.1 NAD(P)H-dependent oxidoreductase [Aliarcobacter trophiarum LMG 25534]